MLKVRTYNQIACAGLDRFPSNGYEVSSEIIDPHAIILRSHKLHDLELNRSLAAVGRAGAGVNNVPVERMSAAGVVVFNAPGANANAVKELVIAGMLLAARNIPSAWDFSRSIAPGAEDFAHQVEAGKKKFVGFELPGKTLGVVGLGAIGVKVANAAIDLGMNVVGFDPHITVEGAWKLSSRVEAASNLDELLGQSDFVTFHVPLNDATRGLFAIDRLSAVKDGAVVMNFARDGVVDDSAVLEGLADGKLSGYVTDFPSPQLQAQAGVICLPHLGASTAEAETLCAVMVVDQLRDYLENGNIVNSVNFPKATLQRKGDARVCVVNENRPDMIGQISHTLGKAELNILHMRNESRGDLGYNLIDVCGKVEPGLDDQLSAIDGVLRSRVLT